MKKITNSLCCWLTVEITSNRFDSFDHNRPNLCCGINLKKQSAETSDTERSETDGTNSDSEDGGSVDDRSGFAQAYDQASQVFSACLIMVLPSLGGYFLDQRLNTGIVLTVSGLVFGFVVGFVQLVKLTRANSKTM